MSSPRRRCGRPTRAKRSSCSATSEVTWCFSLSTFSRTRISFLRSAPRSDSFHVPSSLKFYVFFFVISGTAVPSFIPSPPPFLPRSSFIHSYHSKHMVNIAAYKHTHAYIKTCRFMPPCCSAFFIFIKYRKKVFLPAKFSLSHSCFILASFSNQQSSLSLSLRSYFVDVFRCFPVVCIVLYKVQMIAEVFTSVSCLAVGACFF